MANIDTRRKENKSGEFFVDESCISCAACWKEAPLNFESHPTHTYSYVYRQPLGKSEKEACLRAMRLCPVSAIGRQARRLKSAL
jgi:ferredoxin